MIAESDKAAENEATRTEERLGDQHREYKVLTAEELGELAAGEHSLDLSQGKLRYFFQGRVSGGLGLASDGQAYLRCLEEQWEFRGQLQQQIRGDDVWVFPKAGTKRFYREGLKQYSIFSKEWAELRADSSSLIKAQVSVYESPDSDVLRELYYGTLRGGQYHGLGVLYGQGFIYRGQFKEGAMSGHGKMLTNPARPQLVNAVLEGVWEEGSAASPWMEFMRDLKQGNSTARVQKLVRTDGEPRLRGPEAESELDVSQSQIKAER